MTDSLSADAWLGRLLGKAAFHLSPAADPAMPLAAPAFIDAKVATGDIGRVQKLAQAGYRLVDTNVRLDRPNGALDVPVVTPAIRAANPQDADAVRALGSSAFRFDRFHADPDIPKPVADRIKGEWAGNYFNGRRGNRMIVAAEKGEVLGFLQIIDRPDHSIIDLIAVATPAQGRGLAGAMIAYAVRQGPANPWRVGTQVANVPSLRLYERLGFRCAETQYVFHRHVN